MMSTRRTLLTLLCTFALLAGMLAWPAAASDPGWADRPLHPDSNQERNWEAWAAANGETWICDKVTDPDVTVDGGLAYYEMPDPPAGYMWRLLKVKAGTVDTLYWNPVAGELYPSDRDSISHVIRCRMEVPTGAVLVNKVDEADQPLAGAGFTLTVTGDLDDPGVAMTEIQTGVFCTDGLEINGSYTATETTVPDGYTGGAPVVLTPVAGTNCSTNLPTGGAVGTVTNTPAPGDVYIEKVDDLGNPMAGVTFRLTDGDEYDETCTTDALGECEFLDVPLGTYTLSETVPDGYSIGDVTLDGDPVTLPHTFTIGLGDAPGQGQEFLFEVENVRVPGEVTIEKVDEFGEPMADVTFRLTDGDEYDETCTTDADGGCGFEEVPLGTYTLSEDVPLGYAIGEVTLNGAPVTLPHTFTIGLGDAPGEGQSFAFVVENVPVGEWCSPGYWRNHPVQAAAAAAAGGFSLHDPYSDFFDPIAGLNQRQLNRLGLSTSPTLWEVLQHPQAYGGAAFNNVGDLLSDAHPDVNFGGERVEDSCPL